jgi:hypothetical protein
MLSESQSYTGMFWELDAREDDLLRETRVNNSGTKFSRATGRTTAVITVVAHLNIIPPLPVTIRARHNNALSVLAPFIGAKMVRHIQTGQ